MNDDAKSAGPERVNNQGRQVGVRMTKDKLIVQARQLAARDFIKPVWLTEKELRTAYDFLCAAIKGALLDGDYVALPGIGRLYVKQLAATRWRNPRSGEIVDIPSRASVGFRATRALKEAVKNL